MVHAERGLSKEVVFHRRVMFLDALLGRGGGEFIETFPVTSEIQKVRAHKLMVNKFQQSKCLVTETLAQTCHMQHSVMDSRFVEKRMCIKFIIN